MMNGWFELGEDSAVEAMGRLGEVCLESELSGSIVYLEEKDEKVSKQCYEEQKKANALTNTRCAHFETGVPGLCMIFLNL